MNAEKGREDMRRDVILTSGFTILLLIVIVSAAFLSLGSAQTITANIKFEPKFINLGLPAPSVVEATIRFENESVTDINATTIRLEGTLPPDTTYLITGALIAEFDGQLVVNIINAKINHMGIAPPYKVWLTISGNLIDSAGGTPFSGTSWIKTWVPHNPPPP